MIIAQGTLDIALTNLAVNKAILSDSLFDVHRTSGEFDNEVIDAILTHVQHSILSTGHRTWNER